MALTANRIEERHVSAAVAPDAWGQGLGDTFLEQWYYDHPYPHLSIMVFERKTYTDQAGHVIGIEADTWDYDEATRSPRTHLREVWAYIWLPGVTNRYALVKVEEDRTVYLVAGWLIGGQCSERTTKAGYVIYDLLATMKPLTEDQKFQLEVMGVVTDSDGKQRYSPTVELQLQTQTGRVWEGAKDSAAIVKKATVPQKALWRDPFEVKEITVEPDFQKTVTWTYQKNFLQSGPPTVTRTEQLNNPQAINLPLDLAAPELKGQSAAAAGVRLEINGGGADLKNMDQWFVEHVQHIRPEKYAVYRKVVTQAPRTPTGDTYGILATPTAYVPRTIGPIEDVTVIDFAGAPADPLPTATSYTEPEDPTPPVPEVWSMLVEVANAETDPSRPGKAVTFDTTVESGSTYEYYAVAVLGTQESTESNHVTIPYVGPLNFQSGIRVAVHEFGDGSLQIDVSGPPIPGLPDGYGRVQTMMAVVAFDSPLDAATFGREAYLAQALQDGLRQHLSIGLTTPLLTIERGQRVTIPEILFTTRGNNLQLDSRIVPGAYLIDGFGWSVSRDKNNNWVIDPGTLELISP